MKSHAIKRLLWLTAMLAPTALILWVPEWYVIGPALLILAFSIVTITFYIASFRRHKAGPFALYIQPKKYLSIRFSARETAIFKVGLYIALSALLSLVSAVSIGRMQRMPSLTVMLQGQHSAESPAISW